jgi:hypothetical protein
MLEFIYLGNEPFFNKHKSVLLEVYQVIDGIFINTTYQKICNALLKDDTICIRHGTEEELKVFETLSYFNIK